MSQIVRLLPETGNCRDTFQIGDGNSRQTVESYDECIQVCETVRCGREVFRVKKIFRVPCITLWWRRSQGAQFLGSQIEPTFVSILRIVRQPLLFTRETGGTSTMSAAIPAPSQTCTLGHQLQGTPTTPTRDNSSSTSGKASKLQLNFRDTPLYH